MSQPWRRRATQEDAAHVLGLLRAFYEDERPAWPWEGDAFAAWLSNMIASQFVNVSEGGFCIGYAAPLPFSPGWVQAHELFLWASDGSGAGHMRDLRAWANDQGARSIEWSCRSRSDRVSRVFSRIATPTMVGFSEVL